MCKQLSESTKDDENVIRNEASGIASRSSSFNSHFMADGTLSSVGCSYPFEGDSEEDWIG